MYICVCKGISDKQLRETYIQKKGNVKETLKALGVGSECGVCVKSALEEIQSEVSHHKTSKTDVKTTKQS
jgi:bacterioferritin-associated ferredoxin